MFFVFNNVFKIWDVVLNCKGFQGNKLPEGL
jgi:hypothetical protein